MFSVPKAVLLLAGAWCAFAPVARADYYVWIVTCQATGPFPVGCAINGVPDALTPIGGSAYTVGGIAHSGGTSHPQMGDSFSLTAWSAAGSITQPDLIVSPSSFTLPYVSGNPGPNYALAATFSGQPCVTSYTGTLPLSNPGTAPVFYQFLMAGITAAGSSSSGMVGGCSPAISVYGDHGSDVTGGSWLAVYPGESFTVSCTGVGPCGLSPILVAYAASSQMQPCDDSILMVESGQQRCVNLCIDGQPVAANMPGFSSAVGWQPMTNSLPPAATNTIPAASNGPAGGLWPSTTNIGYSVSGPAENQTLVYGFGQVVGSESNLLSGSNSIGSLNLMLSNALGNLHVIVSNQVVVTNVVTNGGGYDWSVTGRVAADLASNGWDSASLSNQGAAAGAGLSNAWSGAVGVVPVWRPVGVGTGGDGMSVDMPPLLSGSNFSVVMSWASLGPAVQGWVGGLRAFLGFICVAVCWYWMVVYGIHSAEVLYGTGQTRGSGQSVAGTNAAAVTGAAYAAVFLASVFSLPAGLVAFLAGHVELASAFSSAVVAVSVVASNPMWQLCSSAVPVDVLCSCVLDWILFRLLVMPGIVMIGSVIRILQVS